VVAVLRPSRVICSVLPRQTIVGLFAFVAGIALLPGGVAAADSVTSNFDTFNVGTVNAQQGWKSAAPGDITTGPNGQGSPGCVTTGGQFDQAVVNTAGYPNGAASGFAPQALRFSNLCASGEFSFQTYSTPVNDPAGEDQTNQLFTAQFSFIPTTPEPQDGLYVSVSPDNGMGGRMLRIDLTSTKAGVEVDVAHAPGLDGDIAAIPVKVLDPSKPHTIKMAIKFNPGPNNDLARVSIDGQDTGQCFSSWENFYRKFQPDMLPTNTDLQFRAAVGSFDTTTNAGYLFDNVTTTTSTGAGLQGCDLIIDKQADSPTVSAGSIEGYRLTVRNRGHLSERNLLLCDHIPNHTTLVSADRKLRRLGRRRCLLIPRLEPGQTAGVHLMLRVSATAPPGTLDNVADITPAPPPGVPAVPSPVLNGDLPQGAVAVAIAKLPPIAKAKVLVKILRAKRTALPPPPAVTG
jgi:uncharacterized repeat protein (TIGR01451 family)